MARQPALEAGMRKLLQRKTQDERRWSDKDNKEKRRAYEALLLHQ